MEHQTKIQLKQIADRQVKDAAKYAEAREASGIAEMKLNIIVTANISQIRKLKKNAGIEFAQLMVCSREDFPDCAEEAESYYRAYKQNEAIYKGLEKLIEARGGQLIMEQSLLKNERDGTKYG